ncbi:UDP-3-O-(3-hydroxymyristoyl)glucosamine N-acyltransferase [Caulobacter mirabilis]|uniref:UDP-3-O-acylglucosamine N-acyltransferase n=1 Tax=Caulobacter mirabilis TaxID=69666 RepID=A0A2D2AXW2_9CAUL|nr:UDP-3-O-(3-hydroxymyristoyl)glucosamine N-acyltransferase [Caulobacter mirabilis]ATQ42844.1 UDP-3-O-(3-hydroxymyristoyl)glucosamine N-acyltransferase [Caulobacter mirabilis]
MADPRFFLNLGPIPLADLVALAGGAPLAAEPGAMKVEGVAPLDRAGAADVAFVADRKHVEALRTTGAGAVFVSAALADQVPATSIAVVVDRPQAAWARAAAALHRPRMHEAGAPAVHPSAELEDGVLLSPNVVIGAGVKIGRGTRIAPGAVIGPGVAIGRDCEIGANASIGFALIGDRVRLYAGARIGEAGFGAVAGEAGVADIPQLGRAILQDGVTIGANSCVDRGAWEDTVVGENTKIDNLVHIGHNTRVGRNCVMAAYTGISGSVVIGDGAAFGGRAGVADHVIIGPGARVGAAAGVFREVPAGETWGGYPAQPMKAWLRETAWLSRNARRGKGDKA